MGRRTRQETIASARARRIAKQDTRSQMRRFRVIEGGRVNHLENTLAKLRKKIEPPKMPPPDEAA